MAKGVRIVAGIAIMGALAFWLYLGVCLSAQYNPFSPLSIDDPPTLVTRYKLRQLVNNPQQCLALLRASKNWWVIDTYRPVSLIPPGIVR